MSAVLVLVVCLSAQPDQCEEQIPIFEEPLSTQTCYLSAQYSAIAYLNAHPEYQLKEFRCEIDTPKSERI